jgi:branched-chain amino acid transport system ATP-binding protein
MLLNIENIAVNYGAIRALQGVSLHIGDGEITALIGSNGAGKTTLLRTISGLIKPASGSIVFNDRSIAGIGPHKIVRMGISHVPEGRQVFANLTVKENLLLGAYTQHSQEKIKAGLKWCHRLFPVLEERGNQKAGTLSGGEQQMLAISRALMAQPKLLLLDEPSLGLAPLIVRKIFQIVQHINSTGTTVFLVEQNANMALTIAHRGYVLQSGGIIKSDAAKNLLEDPDVKKAYLGG